jgi:hypothetical protein
MKSLKYLEAVRELSCVVCWGQAVPHHMDVIGMGRNRKNSLQEHYTTIPLCTEHHTEWHNVGNTAFNEKYAIDMWKETALAMAKIFHENYS